jgi:Protein of unknown function (DUF3052)
VSATADAAADRGLVDRLALQPGQTVQERGWDDDVDDDIRVAIEDTIDADLLDEDTDEVADLVLLWWREEDGDLVDALVDALTNLAERGTVLLFTPKTGRPGHVQPAEAAEAALAAGLHGTSTVSAGPDWSATLMVAPKTARK